MKVIVSVFNNLYTDQRVEKICGTLHDNGYKVLLIGCSWQGIPTLDRPYPFVHILLKSRSLKLAYPEFNLKLYHEILRHADAETILVANDLDTLAANFLVSKKIKVPLIYDSHEIYTEMPSVKGRFVQKIWRQLESRIIPNIRYMMTASESYANWFQKKYGIEKPVVVQNFPRRRTFWTLKNAERASKIILYQGAINPSRGLSKIIPAMKSLPNVELWIAGNGPKFNEYKKLSENLNLTECVKFLGKLPPDKLREVTDQADVGLSIEENDGLSYYYSLPNKISDYIQAKVPVVVSNFPEMKKIMQNYALGEMIENHSEEELVQKINTVLNHGKDFYREELQRAASNLCWENDESQVLDLYGKVVAESFSKF